MTNDRLKSRLEYRIQKLCEELNPHVSPKKTFRIPFGLAWPKEDTLPSTTEQCLEYLKQNAITLAIAMAAEIDNCARILISTDLYQAAISREILSDQWPWVDTQGSGQILKHLILQLETRDGVVNQEFHRFLSAYWPGDAAPLPVALWAREALNQIPQDARTHIPNKKHGDIMVDLAEKGILPVRDMKIMGVPLITDKYKVPKEFIENMRCPISGVALLYLADQEIKKDAQRPMMAVDANRTHHSLMMRWKDLPKSQLQQWDVEIEDWGEGCRVELLSQGEHIQLTFPWPEMTLHDEIIRALRKVASWEGLRNWAAWLKLLSVEGSRSGWMRWTLEEHLTAMGYKRKTPEVRAKVARTMEKFTQLELQVTSKNNKKWDRRPLILVGRRFGKIKGGESELEGMELQINPLLYGGVRTEKGRIGNNWWPQTPELPTVDHSRHPYAYALGLILPIRWRLSWNDGKDHMAITGKNLLALAGINMKSHDPGRAWSALERDLAKLQDIDGLGDVKVKGTPRTLDAVYQLYPPDWIADRTFYNVRPVELPAAELPKTGKELRNWRTAKGWTQQKTSEALGVSKQTISNTERKPDKPIAPSIRRAFDQGRGR